MIVPWLERNILSQGGLCLPVVLRTFFYCFIVFLSFFFVSSIYLFFLSSCGFSAAGLVHKDRQNPSNDNCAGCWLLLKRQFEGDWQAVPYSLSLRPSMLDFERVLGVTWSSVSPKSSSRAASRAV